MIGAAPAAAGSHLIFEQGPPGEGRSARKPPIIL